MTSSATRSRQKQRRKLGIGLCFLALIAVVFITLYPYLSLDYLEAQRSNYLSLYDQRPILVLAAFILLSSILIGLSLPTSGVTLLLSGALFGFPLGALVGNIACTFGALIGFLWTRYLFRDFFESRYSVHLAVVNRGVEQEGWFYVFGLRLTMIFPSFLINMLCALTTLRTTTFIGATFASHMIVGTVWAYAGSRFAKIQEGADLLSLELFFSLLLVGVAPLVCKRLIEKIRLREKS